ncbi:hypothetical protein [Cohnella sp. GCM10027633]|uniref:hypothetical protein n=1 Tax=unclassified Cohnella TaxID=2636738 RepID=UPI00362C4DBE
MTSNYLVSETLDKLLELDEELKVNNSSLEYYLGIILRREDGFKYDCTPDDSRVFAHTGSDGDHFAFYTIDEAVALDEAPILLIQPMMFQMPVKVVAKNIRDLFAIYLTIKELYILERFDWYLSEEDMIKDITNNYEKQIIERNSEIEFISKKLVNHLNLSPINNVYKYITDLRREIKVK